MERNLIRQSQLGIEYGETLPDYLAEIFLKGEHEWLSNALVMYGPDAGEVWATEIYSKLISNTLEPHDVEDIAAYLPRMLHMFLSFDIVETEYKHLKEIVQFILDK